jgi:hypothetical protein
MSPIPCFGQYFWEELAPAHDVSFPASFANREACTMEELQQQLSAACSNPFHPFASDIEGSSKQPPQARNWSKILNKLARPSLEDNFLTAAERYDRLKVVPVLLGAFLAPLKVVNKDGG